MPTEGRAQPDQIWEYRLDAYAGDEERQVVVDKVSATHSYVRRVTWKVDENGSRVMVCGRRSRVRLDKFGELFGYRLMRQVQ